MRTRPTRRHSPRRRRRPSAQAPTPSAPRCWPIVRRATSSFDWAAAINDCTAALSYADAAPETRAKVSSGARLFFESETSRARSMTSPSCPTTTPRCWLAAGRHRPRRPQRRRSMVGWGTAAAAAAAASAAASAAVASAAAVSSAAAAAAASAAPTATQPRHAAARRVGGG